VAAGGLGFLVTEANDARALSDDSLDAFAYFAILELVVDELLDGLPHYRSQRRLAEWRGLDQRVEENQLPLLEPKFLPASRCSRRSWHQPALSGFIRYTTVLYG